MKNKNYYTLILLIFTLLISCNRTPNETNVTSVEQQIIIEDEINNETEIATFSLPIGENYDLLTDHYWYLADGRRLEDPSVQTYDWVGPMTPRVIFRILEIPSNSIVYQYRLRNERFTLLYQNENVNKLNIIENTFTNGFYDVELENNFSILTLRKDGMSHGIQNRVGEQTNSNYPLIGIWGKLPYLTEYRLVNHEDCLYYMEIDKEIPFWAVRRGTYLIKQIDDKTFETVSSFPDGQLRLEIRDEREILLRPLFSLPDNEDGLVAPLVMHRSLFRISEFIE